MENSHPTFVFFGSDTFAVVVLNQLKDNGFLPSLIICSTDKPVGRKLIITPPPAKVWALQNTIPVFQGSFIDFPVGRFDLFIVASYGKIIPQAILDIPRHGTWNVHPSLLPKLRGSSPIESAILSESATGVTIIKLDDQIDHGPEALQEKTTDWSHDINSLPYADELENQLAIRGGELLAKIIPHILDGSLSLQEQDHARATFSKKISKADALLDLTESAEKNLRKIRGFNVWPRAYFFADHAGKKIRIIVTKARIENNVLILEKVIPEGSAEMTYADLRRGLRP